MAKYLALKTLLKQIASSIRPAKEAFKEAQRRGISGDIYSCLSKLENLRYDFRHKHIAYCLLRGTPLEKIETRPRDPKRKLYIEPDMIIINSIMALEVIDEKQDVRSCS